MDHLENSFAPDKPPLWVGCAAGFSGDRTDAAAPVVRALAASGQSACLIFETLAERTLALAQLARREQRLAVSGAGIVTELMIAAWATLAWVWLVRWRTARHRHAIWKSLALPAGGVALSWLLAMTLGLHPLNYARSNSPLVERVGAHLPTQVDCIAAPGVPLHVLAALEFQGRWKVDATEPLETSSCHAGLIAQGEGAPVAPPGWRVEAIVRRPTDRTGSFIVLQRPAP